MPKKGKKAAAPKRPRRTPDNPFQASDNSIEYVPLRVIAMRIQAIVHGDNKGKKAEHYHVIWEGFPKEKDYTWEPLENLHGHKELVSDYELWLKEGNKRQDDAAEEKRLVRKRELEETQARAATKGHMGGAKKKKKKTGGGAREGSGAGGATDSHSEDDEDDDDDDDDEDDEDDDEDESDEDDKGDQAVEGTKKPKARRLKSVVYRSQAFVATRNDNNKVVSAKSCVPLEDGNVCGVVTRLDSSSPSKLWAHLRRCHKESHDLLKAAGRGKELPDYKTMSFRPARVGGSLATWSSSLNLPKMLSGQDKVASDVAVVKWMVETARPLTSSGHPSFHDMMWAASGGRYKGPCYSTVSNILAQLASDGKRECKRFINQLEEGGTKIVVGADFWSDSGHALLGCTGHGITQDWQLRFVLIGAIPAADKNHTAELVDDLLDGAFRTLGFAEAQGRLFKCVSDNASNMIAGLAGNGRSPCICHTLELSVKKGCAVNEIDKIIKMANKVVAHFSRSTISSSQLAAIQLAAKLKRQKLMKMVLTRWRSHRDMSLSVVRNRPALETFFSENEVIVDDSSVSSGKKKLVFESREFRVLDQFSAMLETMAMASQVLEGDKYPTIGAALTSLSMCIASLRPEREVVLMSGKSIGDDVLESCVRQARAAILKDMIQRWINDIDDNVKRTLLIGAMLDPRFKDVGRTAPEFAIWDCEKNEIFEFELLGRWVQKEPIVEMGTDAVAPAAASPPATPCTGHRSGSISMSSFLSLGRPAAGLQAAEPSVWVSESTLSELEKTKIEMKKWLELPSISEVVVIKNADGTTSEHDLDVLAWWRDTGEKDFPRIAVMARLYLAIPASSATAERVFCYAGLTLSDLRKSLLDGTLEAIMWAKWGFPNVPLGRGNLVETNPELCD